MGQHIEVQGNVYGHIGPVSGGIYTNNDLAGIASLVNDLFTHRAELALPTGKLAELEALLNSLQVQLVAPHPNPTIIREGLRSVRTVLESATGGAIGNLVATWVPTLSQFLS